MINKKSSNKFKLTFRVKSGDVSIEKELTTNGIHPENPENPFEYTNLKKTNETALFTL